MGELLIVNKLNFQVVPELFSKKFVEAVFDAYEAEVGLYSENELPIMEDIQQDAYLHELFDSIRSMAIFDSWFPPAEMEKDDKEDFVQFGNDFFGDFLYIDLPLVLNSYNFSYKDYDGLLNLPVGQVW